MEPHALQKMVNRHDDDLYRGDPLGTGLTTRMALVETEVEKLTRNCNRLVWACVIMLLGILGDLLKTALLHAR